MPDEPWNQNWQLQGKGRKPPIMKPQVEASEQRKKQHFLGDYPDDSVPVYGEPYGDRLDSWKRTRAIRDPGRFQNISGDFSKFRDPPENVPPWKQFYRYLPLTGRPKDKGAQASSQDYDMEGYRQKYGEPDQSGGKHLTDEFKRPNHMTFSTDSKYSTKGQEGGRWYQGGDGKWHFSPSPFNLQQHSLQEMQDYFRRVEPDAVLDTSSAAGGRVVSPRLKRPQVESPGISETIPPWLRNYTQESVEQLERAPRELAGMVREQFSPSEFRERMQGYDPSSMFGPGAQAFLGGPLAQQAMEGGMGMIGAEIPHASGRAVETPKGREMAIPQEDKPWERPWRGTETPPTAAAEARPADMEQTRELAPEPGRSLVTQETGPVAHPAERQWAQLPEAAIEREMHPAELGAGVPATRQQAATQAANGNVNRFVMRDLESVFHRQSGRDAEARGRLIQWLKPFGQRGKPVGSPEDVEAFRFGEKDPAAVRTPGSDAIWNEPEFQHFRQDNAETYSRIQKRLRGENPELRQAAVDLNPGYMHRRTIDSIKSLLGEGEDPVTGFRNEMGVPAASATKPRKYFGLEGSDGVRMPGVVYKDGNKIYQVSQTLGQDHINKELIRLPDDFIAEPGARFSYNGRPVRIVEAISRDIEDATRGTIEETQYAKSAYASTALSNLELHRMENALIARDEIIGELRQRGLVQSGDTKRPQTRGKFGIGKGNYVKSSIPGLANQWVHPRAEALMQRYMRRSGGSGDDFVTAINKMNHVMISSLFINPFYHAGNVAIHATIERGFRWLNPAANVREVGNYWRAFNDVRKGTDPYFDTIAQGGRLLFRDVRARRMLEDKMFRGLQEMQVDPATQGMLHRLNRVTGIPIKKLFKAVYGASSDAMWFMGDVMTQASIYERQFYQGRSFHKGAGKETKAQSIRQIHKEVPSYRIPTEEMLPGKAGRMISSAMRSPATGSGLTFMNYHENILRSYATAIDDILQGAKNFRDEAARTEAYNAIGKLAATAGVMALLAEADQYAPDAGMMWKRFGPTALLQLVLDYASNRRLSTGSKVKLASGGLYSPSPLLSGAFAMIGGRDAFTGNLIYGGPGEKAPMSAADVPFSRRLESTLGGAFYPGQIVGSAYGPEPKPGAYYLGLEQFKRKTEQEVAEEKKAKRRKASY